MVNDFWDPILSPARNAVVTFVLNDNYVPGVRVLYRSLLDTNSLNSNTLFVVLDFGLSWGARNLLRSEGMLLDFSYANKNLTSHHIGFKSRYKDNQWMMFTKLNIFGLDYLDRVVYMDADTFALKSIAPLLDKSVTPALSACPERPSIKHEFNAGVIVLDPSPKLLADMIKHFDDADYRCGFRVEDQSFLCHYFYQKWKSLGFGYQVYWKDAKTPLFSKGCH